MQHHPSVQRRVLLALSLVLAACSGGGGGGGPGSRFGILSVNLVDGASWPINRPIEIAFNAPVDPDSVDLNSILVREVGGGPIAGEFTLESNGTLVVFQPRCPTLADLSDSGFAFGPTASGLPHRFELVILAGNAPENVTVRSTDGEALLVGAAFEFTTPLATSGNALFWDPVFGPPRARVVGDQIDTLPGNATRIEVGVDAQAHYFERDNGVLSIEPPLVMPLNEFADDATRIAFVIEIDQPVDPSAANLAPSRVRLEYRDAQGLWIELPSSAEIVRNCSSSGATLRLVPLGLLPPDAEIRALLSSQFRDLSGDTSFTAQDNFARASTRPFPGVLPDVFVEDFDTQALRDSSAVIAEPGALWSNGVLSAKFDFAGGGGPGGNFDWKIAAGQTVLLNTVQTSLTGGPDFVPTGIQVAIGGVVDVDDLWIEAGGVLKAEGPNPLLIRASGSVRIDGTLVANGTSSTGVVTLGTTNTPESGAAGQAGGGRGGTGHAQINSANARGGHGFGAFGMSGAGGQGGETGWSTIGAVDKRRGAGGGGGRFGPDVPNPTTGVGAFDQRRIGLDAEPGFFSAADNGAISGVPGPFGGAIGLSPFVDPAADNDFLGVMFDDLQQRLVVGELKKPWAGAGGGAGGDAVQLPSGVFPSGWPNGGYQKGAGGGGGGGSVHILALSDIVFGASGRILCRGGLGGGGENSLAGGYARVGGGSGGGAGGHVILETAGAIDLSACLVSPNSIPILATGGQGGAGAGNVGGAKLTENGTVETAVNADACPPGYVTTGANPCRGHVDGAGGDGGPGLIQLHTSTGIVGTLGSGADIVLPIGATLATVCQPPALCVGGAGVDGHMLPSFGRLSRARSRWISLGLGGLDVVNGQLRDIEFELEGLDPASGAVAADANGRVVGATALLSPGLVLAAPALPHIVIPGGRAVVLDAGALIGTADEVLLTNVALLVHCAIELYDIGDPTDFERYDIAAAQHDVIAGTLTLTLDGDEPPMTSFNSGNNVGVVLRPTYFRVSTDDVSDDLPSSAAVFLRLEATSADSLGQPDLAASTGWTADPAVLNAIPNGDVRFVRFDVLFDIDALGQGLSASSPVPSLEFLRLPFRF